MWKNAGVLLAGLLCGGCFWLRGPGYEKVKAYDLQIPSDAGTGCRVYRVVNLSPAGTRMLLREPDGRMVQLDADWVQRPEEMIRRYLNAAFSSESARTIQVELTRFELERASMQAVLAVDMTDRTSEVRRHCEFKAPLQDAGGASAAAAMSACAGQMVQKIAEFTKEK